MGLTAVLALMPTRTASPAPAFLRVLHVRQAIPAPSVTDVQPDITCLEPVSFAQPSTPTVCNALEQLPVHLAHLDTLAQPVLAAALDITPMELVVIAAQPPFLTVLIAPSIMLAPHAPLDILALFVTAASQDIT